MPSYEQVYGPDVAPIAGRLGGLAGNGIGGASLGQQAS